MSDKPSEPVFPDELPIQPLNRPPNATIRVPGSKSITNRALVLSALARGSPSCEIHGALWSEDTQIMADGLKALGFRVTADWKQGIIHVSSCSDSGFSPIPAERAEIFVGNSGTTMRFLTALVALGCGRFRLDGITRMRERPIGDLLDAINQLGGRAKSEKGTGFPPVVVWAGGLRGGEAHIRGDVSSQFLSGLMMAATAAQGDVTLVIDGPLVSRPYIEMTAQMIRQFGGRVEMAPNLTWVHIPGRQTLTCNRYEIEPDASGASYFYAAAAITRGQIHVPGLATSTSIQGDVWFVNLLYEMGCHVGAALEGITVKGWDLHGVDVDMNAISDTVMTLAAVALFAKGPTTIRNVAHIRHKETDRLFALATELRRLGATVDEFADGLTITPGPLHGAAVETYNDHRMAMSLALVGLRVPGVIIKNPACVTKTYPRFFEDLERLRAG